jgi:hypothetical protein
MGREILVSIEDEYQPMGIAAYGRGYLSGHRTELSLQLTRKTYGQY